MREKSKTFFELLKPPFTYDKKKMEVYSTGKMIIDFNTSPYTNKELSVIAGFIVEAMNEKWERDFRNKGEKKAW